MKFELGAKLVNGIGATLTETRKQIQSFEDELRNKGFYDMFITTSALVITLSFIGIYDLFYNRDFSKSQNLVVVENECTINKVYGKKSVYICKPLSKEIVTLERIKSNNLNDYCSSDPINSKKVSCYNTEKDKIMVLERNTKVNMTCVQNKYNGKFKCYGHFNF